MKQIKTMIIFFLVVTLLTITGCDKASRNSSNIVSSISVSSETSSVESVSRIEEVSSQQISYPDPKSQIAYCEVGKEFEKYIPKIFNTLGMLNEANNMSDTLDVSYVIDPGRVSVSFEILVKAMREQKLTEATGNALYKKYGPATYIYKKEVDRIIQDTFANPTENITFLDFGRVYSDGTDDFYRMAITEWGGPYSTISFLTNIKQENNIIIADVVNAYTKAYDPRIYYSYQSGEENEKYLGTINLDGRIDYYPDDVKLARKARYTFKIEDGTVKLYAIGWEPRD